MITISPHVANPLFTYLLYLPHYASTSNSDLSQKSCQMSGFRSSFKHIYIHEGFHLASGSCRFSIRCSPNTAPPAPKSIDCSSSKIRSLKNRSPKTRSAPTHTPRLPNLLGHGLTQVRKSPGHKGTLHVHFLFTPPVYFAHAISD